MTSTPPTLRERRRRDLTAEILAVAGRHLATEGLAALSLRAIARELGMAVSALYRYYPSRDDLVTALLEQAYLAQADAVEVAAAMHGRDPVGALRAGLLEFRAWSVRHAVEYGLMYGSPLPGYAAPPERLIAAGTRVGLLLFRYADEAERRGQLAKRTAASRTAALPAEHLGQVDAWRARRIPEISLEAAVVTIDLWVRLQGMVSLEVFGQLRPVLPEPAAYFEAAVDQAFKDAGLRRQRVTTSLSTRAGRPG